MMFLLEGNFVFFEKMTEDVKRPGKFRTEHAQEISFFDLATLAEPEFYSLVTKSLYDRHAYHFHEKKIDPQNIEMAQKIVRFWILLLN